MLKWVRADGVYDNVSLQLHMIVQLSQAVYQVQRRHEPEQTNPTALARHPTRDNGDIVRLQKEPAAY